MTPEEILQEYYGLIWMLRNEYGARTICEMMVKYAHQKAKEEAGKAFEAGENYRVNMYEASLYGEQVTHRSKEQYLKQAFPEQ